VILTVVWCILLIACDILNVMKIAAIILLKLLGQLHNQTSKTCVPLLQTTVWFIF